MEAGDLVPMNVNDKIAGLVEGMIPKAHQESAKLLMEESEKKDKIIADLEITMVERSEEYSDLFTKFDELKTHIEDIKAREVVVEAKEDDLRTRESSIKEREVNQNHHDEIATMKVAASESEKAVITDVLHTIFKPPALRTTIHKNIPLENGTIMAVEEDSKEEQE